MRSFKYIIFIFCFLIFSQFLFHFSSYIFYKEIDFKNSIKIKDFDKSLKIKKQKPKNCPIETNQYYSRPSLSFYNYCPLLYETNLPSKRVFSLNDINLSELGLFYKNLSSDHTSNHLRQCTTHCINTAHPYLIIRDSICYCINIYQYNNLKFLKKEKNPTSEHLFIYKTGAHPIQYSIPSFIKSSENVVVVYLLMINGRDVISFSRLFRTIYSAKDHYFIHIDKRQKFMIKHLHKMNYKNVYIFDWSMTTIWGGSSLLTAYRRAMKSIISKNIKWDFLINLSESDYLIQSKEKLDAFLSSNKEKNFVKSSGQSISKFIEKQALKKAFVECDEHLFLLENRSLPSNIVIDGGSDWFALSFNFVQYLVTSKDLLINNLFNFFKNSLLPAETFFHTALQNSNFCHTVVNSNLKLTNWNRKRGCRCQHSSVVGWCGCSPSILRNYDYDRLMNAIKHDRTLFFARKFDSFVDYEILNRIDKDIHKYLSKCRQKSYSHILNFYSSLQDNGTYSYLADLLFTAVLKNYTKEATKFDCLWNPVINHDTEIYLLVNNITSLNERKEVLISYQKEFVYFEAIMEYVGEAGVMSRLSMNRSSLMSYQKELKSMKISQNYDVKENIFRTPSFLMIGTKPLFLELHIDSQNFKHFSFYVVFTDPNSVKYNFQLPNITTGENSINQVVNGKSTIVWFQGFDLPLPYQSGLWEVVLYCDKFRLALMKNSFYIQQKKSDFNESIHNVFKWRLKKLCLYSDDKSCLVSKKYQCTQCSLNNMLKI